MSNLTLLYFGLKCYDKKTVLGVCPVFNKLFHLGVLQFTISLCYFNLKCKELLLIYENLLFVVI